MKFRRAELNVSTMLIIYKIDYLIKKLTFKQKTVYLKHIDTHKQILLRKSSKYVICKKIAEFISMRDLY